ncbi:MAG: hypothetical protein AAF550_08540 [Myxococcota bacterium]
MIFSGLLTSIGLGFSLLLLLISERVLTSGTGHTALLGFAAFGVLAAAWNRARLSMNALGVARTAHRHILLTYVGVICALMLYGMSTPLGRELFQIDEALEQRWEVVLTVLFSALLTLSLTTLTFMELAAMRMPVPEAVELRRIHGAAQMGLSLSLSLIFMFSINYIARERDVRRDLSYFKTTEPSETTLRMVRGLGEPLEVYLVFPRINEVLDQMAPYFERVGMESDQIQVEHIDHALAPKLAQQHRIRGNGFVLLVRGEGDSAQAKSFEVGMDLERARSRLRTLDGRFQESFSELTQVRRALYLTVGHRERSARGEPEDSEDERLSGLSSALERSNVQTKTLGVAQGLASDVPDDAPAVAVIGPREPFLKEESDALVRYVRAGGRVILMLDPLVEHGLDDFLRKVGLETQRGVVSSETAHVRQAFAPSDRALVYTKSYSSHPTVTIASRNARQVASIFLRGVALKRTQGKDAIEGIQVNFPIRSGSDVWRDLDGDWTKGADEASGQVNLMAAVTIPSEDGDEGRVVVIGDGDFVTDRVVRNPGNIYVFADVLQWLLGAEQIVGPTASEEDVRIEHTNESDKLWFWSTVLGVPLPLFFIGLLIGARRFAPGAFRRAAPQDAPSVDKAASAVEPAPAVEPASAVTPETPALDAGEEAAVAEAHRAHGQPESEDQKGEPS